MHFLKTLTAIVFGHIKENLKSFRATMKSVVFFCVFDCLPTFKMIDKKDIIESKVKKGQRRL